MLQVEHFLHPQNRLGEGPLWNPREKLLYWVDIEGECFHRYSPESGEGEIFPLGQEIGCLAFRESGGLVLGIQAGLAFWDQYTSEIKIIDNPEAGRVNARFNDGKVDPGGRFWAGTLGDDDESCLYRLDLDGNIQVMETGIGISNGIGWSPDHETMYYTDSPQRVVYAYDYELKTGSIKNRREFIKVPEEDGFPDGLTVDSEGFIWSAHWDGWRITRYDPEGKAERVVYLPVQRPTSCTFGGPDLDQLFITSAWTGLSETERREQPLAGDLFLVYAEVKGQKEYEFLG